MGQSRPGFTNCRGDQSASTSADVPAASSQEPRATSPKPAAALAQRGTCNAPVQPPPPPFGALRFRLSGWRPGARWRGSTSH